MSRRWTDLVGLCRAIQFESPSSWLTRAALSQGVSVRELAMHIGWYPAHDLDLMFGLLYRDGLPQELGVLAGLEVARRVLVGHQQAGCRPESLLTAGLKQRVRKLDGLMPTARRRSRYRFCPACLKADQVPFIRLEWRFNCWRLCPEHEGVLQSRCPACAAPLELPISLVSAGRRKLGVADLSCCASCGESLTSAEAVSLDLVAAEGLGWDRVHFDNGRAALSAMYYGRLRVKGEAQDRPFRHLALLESLSVLPSLWGGDDDQ